MRVLEYDEDDFRSLELTEKEQIDYRIDDLQLNTLMMLGYELVTDGDLVYASKGTDDIIEIGRLPS